MNDKAKKHPNSGRASGPRDPESPTPITPIGNSGLSEAIKHGSRIYQLMVESVRDYAIFMLDPRGYIASWNVGAQRIKGYTADEIIGRHFSVFYPQSEIDAGKPALELEIAAREGRFEEEGIRLRKDGTAFWASVVLTAVRDDDGALVGYAKVTRDLTERRAAQQRAIADARRLAESEAANSAKSEFLTAMSHELRTPLNAIGGYADLLTLGLGGPMSAEQAQYLDRIRRSQQHLMGIITDILNFSRIEAGQISYSVAPVVLSNVVDTVLPMVIPQAISKGIQLERGMSPANAIALADQAKVSQILLNLLSNAVKFTKSGGRITVDVESTPTHACLTVKDTGMGIPPDKLQTIFEPFVQLGRSFSSAHEGTGLGLSISRDLAQAMKGNLTVSSVEGVGSTFIVSLPVST
jgi:PAS domain S-box-containing protein